MPEAIPPERRVRRPALTITTLIVIGAAAGVIALVVRHPVRRALERADRTKCHGNGLHLGVASIAYTTNSFGPGQRKGYTPHITAMNQPDGPEHVGLVFEMLVNAGEMTTPELFVCPSSDDVPHPLMPGQPPSTYRMPEHDVRSEDAPFSYGWKRGQYIDFKASATTIMSADRSVSDPGWFPQHADGRNLLRFDGSVDFLPREIEDAASALVDEDLMRKLRDGLNLARPGGLPAEPR